MASIFIMSGPNKGDYYPLGVRTNIIGRDEALLVQILDPKVSRKHMKIRFDQEGNRYCAADMGSKHGVYINGRMIMEETTLNEGDQIRIGATTLFFTVKDFPDEDSALNHFKIVGERSRETLVD